MRRKLCFAVLFCAITLSSLGAAFAEETDSILGVQPSLYDSDPKTKIVRSGVAHDASENLFMERVDAKEPRSFFKPDAKQMTYWAQFKSFKFRGKPKLEGRWYSPSGKQVATQQFKGHIFIMAKTTLKMEGPVEEGTWRIDVYRDGQKIDSKNFVVYGGPKAPVLKLDPPKQDGVVKPSLKVEVQTESGAPSAKKEFLDK